MGVGLGKMTVIVSSVDVAHIDVPMIWLYLRIVMIQKWPYNRQEQAEQAEQAGELQLDHERSAPEGQWHEVLALDGPEEHACRRHIPIVMGYYRFVHRLLVRLLTIQWAPA